MSLLSLPAELRLRIYDYLPDLQWNRFVTISANSKLTPSICRINKSLRIETIPVYAQNSLFALQIDNAGLSWFHRIACLLDALGPSGLPKIRSFQISRHWSISQPQRWQGHVGFYVRIEQRKPKKIPSSSSVNSGPEADSFCPEWNDRFVRPMTEGDWEVTTGTYPLARDLRGMRLKSVELLAEVIRDHLHIAHPISTSSSSSKDVDSGLTRQNVDFINQSMAIVAAHPISTFNAELQNDEIWSDMEQQLRALTGQAVVLDLVAGDDLSSSFFTPT